MVTAQGSRSENASGNQPAKPPATRFALYCVLLTAATALVYAQVWRFDFITLDDPLYVLDNPHVREGLTTSNVAWAFTNQLEANWIPVTWLSLFLDTTVYGSLQGWSPGEVHAGGYHLTNVILHVLNTLLLFAFLVQITKNELRSAFVAALFALHPMHVESVAWIAERKDVLSTLFGLLSLLAYAKYAHSQRKWALFASLVSLVLSLMSKPTLVTLPFVFLLLDYWPLRRAFHGRARTSLLVEKIPFFAVSACFCAIALAAQSHGVAIASNKALPLAWRLANAVTAYALYLWRTVFPQGLAIYYPLPRGSLSAATVAVAASVLLAVSAAAIVFWRRLPYLFVGWCWYLGTLVPMIGIVQVGSQQMADRYTYFPLIGLFVAVTWLVAEAMPANAFRARVLPACAMVILLGLGITTFRQIGYWRDSETVFTHAIDSGHDSALARSVLGVELVSKGVKRGSTDEVKRGIEMHEKAVQMEPEQSEFHFTLGYDLERAGQLDRAAKEYRAAIGIGKRDLIEARARNNLGYLLWKHVHDLSGARQQFLEAIAIDPEQHHAYGNLARVCEEMGLSSEAERYRKRAAGNGLRRRTGGRAIEKMRHQPETYNDSGEGTTLRLSRRYSRVIRQEISTRPKKPASCHWAA